MSTIIIILMSMAIMSIGMPIVIKKLKEIRFGQSVRTDGPQSHLVKQGTPTMGGIAFISTTLFVGLIFSRDPINILLALSMFLYGLIGFIDDYLIIVRKNTDGLSSKKKLFLQLLFAILLYLLSKWMIPDFSSSIQVFPTNLVIDLGYYYVFVYLFIYLAMSNAVNLTDGLDGLSTSVTMVVLIGCLGLYLMMGGKLVDVSIVLALLGSLAIFLLYNKVPAQIFMGDTGSLAIGGLIAGFALFFKVELIVLVFSVIYFAETISVMVQVLYFKRTGKRIFKMAPLHHHYELCGQSEKTIVRNFTLINSLFILIGWGLYYIAM